MKRFQFRFTWITVVCHVLFHLFPATSFCRCRFSNDLRTNYCMQSRWHQYQLSSRSHLWGRSKNQCTADNGHNSPYRHRVSCEIMHFLRCFESNSKSIGLKTNHGNWNVLHQRLDFIVATEIEPVYGAPHKEKGLPPNQVALVKGRHVAAFRPKIRFIHERFNHCVTSKL